MPTLLPQLARLCGAAPRTDAELLDLFKGHPVALVGRPGKQTLIVFDEKPN